jgi:BMFP domain-containing protein YqiC
MERRHISEGAKRIARQEARVAEATERGYNQLAVVSREVLSIFRQSLELTRARLQDLEARYPDAATSC